MQAININIDISHIHKYIYCFVLDINIGKPTEEQGLN